uniref:ATP synthase complex subunit 8 n=1 Tax=Oreolalax major TaxID=445774 RepID=A0A1P8A9U5_9ANUR|nr:ATP synthase subunit 8 [Oreolalax major]QKZ95146.1 ATP synthase F0 subunit 8 [Oreolalax major]
MPQLNPSPWFFILTLSWLVFLFIFTSKIKNIRPLQKPHTTLIFVPTINHWPWSWT